MSGPREKEPKFHSNYWEKMTKNIALLLGFGMLGLVVSVGCDNPPTAEKVEPNTKVEKTESADAQHHALTLTTENFDSSVLESDQLVLVDFWATWCPPCVAIAPDIEELAKDYEGKLVVGKVDVDSNKDLAMEYDVTAIPHLMFVKNGEVVKIAKGRTAKALKAEADELMAE